MKAARPIVTATIDDVVWWVVIYMDAAYPFATYEAAKTWRSRIGGALYRVVYRDAP